MKKLFLISLFFLSTTLSISQTIGFSGSLLNYNSYQNLGFGGTIDYGFIISEKTNITLSTSLLLANQKEEGRDLSYFQIPITVGLRYFVIKSYFSPYLAVEVGGSYSNADLIRSVKTSSGSYNNEYESYKEFKFGFGTSIGTFIKITNKIDINISARQYNVLVIPTSFLTYNVGVVYNIE